MMMPRIVMGLGIAVPCPGVHGIVPRPLDARRACSTFGSMSRETVNLICAELPGTEKVPGPDGRDQWTAAGEEFAQVGEMVEVRTDGGWEAVPRGLPEPELRARIVEAYERLRHLLPAEDQPRLDRTSG